MNCHSNNNEKYEGHKHGVLKYILHMLLCCGLPIVIIGFLPLIIRISPGAGSFVSKIIPFICPIMMVSMVAMMMGGGKKKSCCDHSSEESSTKKIA